MDLTPVDKEHYEVARSLDNRRPECRFTRADFVAHYRQMFADRNEGSIQPADYTVPSSSATEENPKFLGRLTDMNGRLSFTLLDLHWLPPHQ